MRFARAHALMICMGMSIAAGAPGMDELHDMAPLDVAALDAWWDFQRPGVSESRFRSELSKLRSGSAAVLELQTQIARAQGLQRQFDAAHATLDAVEKALPRAPQRVGVRYLLERGRVLNSSGNAEKAVPLFRDALLRAQQAGEDFLAIDAAHMLGIAALPPDRLQWNLQALAMAERTPDARSRRWLASLYNNIGWTYHERGEYAVALEYFEKALPAWKARGKEHEVRVAEWAIARGMRSLERYDEALAIQGRLLAENEKNGVVDGYVFEELGELEIARGDATAAQPWFRKAYAELSQDSRLKAQEPERLERLRRLGETP